MEDQIVCLAQIQLRFKSQNETTLHASEWNKEMLFMKGDYIHQETRSCYLVDEVPNVTPYLEVMFTGK